MLRLLNQEQFTPTALVNSEYILTDIIRDIKNFGGQLYADETNTYYVSIRYGGVSEVVVVFDRYSKQSLERAKAYFKDAACFDFVCPYNEFNEAEIDKPRGVMYLYKYLGVHSDSLRQKTDVRIQKADAGSVSALQTYDDMYLSFLPPKHAARLVNTWNKHEETIYLAHVGPTPVGYILLNEYPEYHACDITQITVEEPFQRKGYGKQLLRLVVKDVLEREYKQIFYSSVESDNTASIKTAESVGFERVACRVSIH